MELRDAWLDLFESFTSLSGSSETVRKREDCDARRNLLAATFWTVGNRTVFVKNAVCDGKRACFLVVRRRHADRNFWIPLMFEGAQSILSVGNTYLLFVPTRFVMSRELQWNRRMPQTVQRFRFFDTPWRSDGDSSFYSEPHVITTKFHERFWVDAKYDYVRDTNELFF